MKIATDLEQSRKLAEFLPIESADMFYFRQIDDDYFPPNIISIVPTPIIISDDKKPNYNYDIPAWSLSALMNAIPNRVEYEFKTYFFKLETDVYSSGEKYYDLGYQSAYGWLEYEDSTELVDACVNLIIKLHERELI